MIYLLPALIFLSSCANLLKSTPEVPHFRNEMRLKVNDVRGYGAVVVDQAAEYKIYGGWIHRTSEALEAFNCYRHYVLHPTKRGIFRRRNKYINFTFKTDSEVEATRAHCPILISVHDPKSRHSLGRVYIRRGETLKATLACNGPREETTGVSFCQTRAGAVVLLEFDSAVESDTLEGCNPIKQSSPNVVEFLASPGECVYGFMDAGGKVHKHVSFGYEEIIVKETDD